jgi:hypothetical protein
MAPSARFGPSCANAVRATEALARGTNCALAVRRCAPPRATNALVRAVQGGAITVRGAAATNVCVARLVARTASAAQACTSRARRATLTVCRPSRADIVRAGIARASSAGSAVPTGCSSTSSITFAVGAAVTSAAGAGCALPPCDDSTRVITQAIGAAQTCAITALRARTPASACPGAYAIHAIVARTRGTKMAMASCDGAITTCITLAVGAA